jgi:cell division initiation protein
MRLSAADIRQQQFAVKLIRGFDPPEVDAFLEEIADDFEELIKENNLLKEQLVALEERNKGIEARERTLQETLVTTQKIAEEFKENARAQADLERENARTQADLLVREGQLRADKLIQDSREEHVRLSADIGAMKRLRRQLIEEILGTLGKYKRLIEHEQTEGDARS